MTDDRRDRLEDGAGLVRAGLSPEDAAELVGLPARLIEVFAGCSGRIGFVPSPDEITERAAAIRATWSDSERRNRASSRRQGQHANGVDAVGIREFVSTGDAFVMVE